MVQPSSKNPNIVMNLNLHEFTVRVSCSYLDLIDPSIVAGGHAIDVLTRLAESIRIA